MRFARVPTGGNTCAFCYMLAGRGAVYTTREKAGELNKFHHHCDCKIVPGFEDDPDAELVEGWRPAEVRERLALIERQCGAKVGSEWKENDEVTRSMRLRDPDWLHFGNDAKPDYSLLSNRQRKCLTTNEKSGHEILGANGFKLKVLPTDRRGKASIDLELGAGAELWELKTPIKTGARLHTRLDEGVSKWIRLHKNGEIGASTPKIIVDARFCTMPDDEVEAVIRDRMEFWESEHFDEAILIRHDGSISEIKK